MGPYQAQYIVSSTYSNKMTQKYYCYVKIQIFIKRI